MHTILQHHNHKCILIIRDEITRNILSPRYEPDPLNAMPCVLLKLNTTGKTMLPNQSTERIIEHPQPTASGDKSEVPKDPRGSNSHSRTLLTAYDKIHR